MLHKKKGTKKRIPAGVAGAVIIALSLILFSTARAHEEKHEYSDVFSMKIDPSAKKMLGEKKFKAVMDFYYEAERAIEKEDLKGLMALYSDNYQNGQHTKKSAEEIWKRIFDTFDNMAVRHNMEVLPGENDNMVIIRCSGLLVGTPAGEKFNITIDNWNLEEHVLISEEGRWKLVGNTGQDRKRLWFDQPMHPLF